MDLISGLLLTAVVVAILYVLIKELVGDRMTETLAKQSQAPKSVEESLIGTVARVVENRDEDSSLIKVRIGIERWSARLAPAHDQELAIGTEVRVTGVDGRVLEVEEVNDTSAA